MVLRIGTSASGDLSADRGLWWWPAPWVETGGGVVAPAAPVAAVVYESMFGSSRAVAGAVAAGLRNAGFEAHVLDVVDLVAAAEPGLPSPLDVVVVGGPRTPSP